MQTVKLICDQPSFRDCAHPAVRWLDWDADFTRTQGLLAPGFALTRAGWDEARRSGYRYAGVVVEQDLLALAAEFRFSDQAWMLAAVRTALAHRRQGYGLQVCAFITAHILANGRLATCETAEDNLAMLATAHRLGYR